MLKWTVMSRRDTAVKPDRLPSTPSSAKAKRRRSTSTRRSRNSLDALEADKENQFTSTPIKADGHIQFEALRDVSNLTPKDRDQDRRVLSAKKCKSSKKSRTPPTSPRLQHKKKKECLAAHYDFLNADSQTSNYFRPFETVDSHIEGVLDENLCHCKKSTVSCDNKRVPDTYAPTLPTFATDYSPCTMRTTHCLETLNRTSVKKVTSLRKLLDDENIPPTKKPKVDHVEDFLHQITFLTSPDNLPGFKSESSTSKLNLDSVTPLVKKFLDFKFTIKKENNSSFINDMSLDKIVDAILDSSDDSIRATVRKSLNTSLIVNVESENNMNESQEENMINIVKESKNALENVSENSSDSGFRSSTTENSHALDNNFVCKCNNNVIEKTIIQIDEQYNERCVDSDTVSRKRSSSTSVDSTEAKKIHLDCSQENLAFTLKRQKCIRRRKPFSIERSPFSANKNLKFESTPIRNCYLETKEILSDSISLNTPNEESRGIRRCLLFDSPKISDSLSLSESTSTSKSGITDVRGSMDLRITEEDGMIQVNVIRCKDLYRPNGEKINAYVKVCISDRLGDSRRKKNAILQRTAVQGDSSKPIFNHIFKFPLVNENSAKRVHLEVWHRDRGTRTSEFLGCMSFDVKDAIKEGISGSFRLLPQTTGRTQNEPITSSSGGCEQSGTSATKMCDGNSRSSVCEELVSLDDADGFDLSSKSGAVGGCNRVALSEQQKYADENLFLRYLELDPTEGPDASSAATQRRATGNRNGRTPFTHTKRLIRPPKSGFGFSVVWTHPPRIERVEKGLPADKAGILPGDYIIFVDKHNIVMMPEIDILNLIRSYGNQLTLEIFRRNPSRNGSVPNVKRLSSTPRTSTCTLGGGTLGGSTLLPVVTTPTGAAVQRRPSTVCSTNTASVDYGRRRLHLPQVTFSSEVGSGVIV